MRTTEVKILVNTIYQIMDDISDHVIESSRNGRRAKNKMLELRHRVNLLSRHVLNDTPEPNLDYNEEDISLAGSIT
jgi:cAMP phosphodiesterase